MTTTETTTTQPTNPRRWPWIVAVLAALFVGVGIGAAAADTEPTAVETPEPETIVETVVETETVTEVVEVEVTPQACVDALDVASENFFVAADMLQLVVDWQDEIAEILNADGYLITAEWNMLDVKYAPMWDDIALIPVGDTAQECRDLASKN